MSKKSKIEFDYSKLRGRIVEKYGSISAFCESTGWEINLVSRKLNNKSKMYTNDMIRFISALDIPEDEIHSYFFILKV